MHHSHVVLELVQHYIHLPHRIFTFLLFQIVVDGQQVISVQGMAAPSPIYRMYHIYW